MERIESGFRGRRQTNARAETLRSSSLAWVRARLNESRISSATISGRQVDTESSFRDQSDRGTTTFTSDGRGDGSGAGFRNTSGQRTRIMAVDDNEDIARILKFLLERDEFEADAFTDPVLALSCFQPGKYDLVLTDIRMPKMDGFALFRELKKVQWDIPICFFTSSDISEREFKTILPDSTVAGFIQKPIEINALVRQIRAIIPIAPQRMNESGASFGRQSLP